jgi:L-2,4-diaminobutyrate decarboxylase
LFESEFLSSAAKSKETYQRIISRAAQILAECIPDQPYRGLAARDLADLIAPDVLPQEEKSFEELSESLRVVIANSIAVSHPATIAHLHCPPLLASLVAEVVISALNQSMDSFDQAPIATILEQKLMRWLCAETGLPASSNGALTTGGSQSNYFGLLLARDACARKRWNWSVKKSGLPPEAGKLRILCSETAHFTVEKSASQLGLGTDAVIRVAVDDQFRMDAGALRTELESIRTTGLIPMAIVATAGTTDFGSIDPLAEAVDLARSCDAWLHVDAAYGGALLFSDQQRSKLRRIAEADSIAIDFHKLFWQPIPCSAFLLRDRRHFDLIKLHADYLNPESHEPEGIPDLVTHSLLTSRRFDALKLWISFQSLGRAKLGAMIDRTIALAGYAADIIRRTPQLQLICEPQLSTVVFRYAPAGDNKADAINAAIRQRLFNRGTAVIGHTRVRNQQCLKFTCMNPAVAERQMEDLISAVTAEGNALAGK